MADNMQMKDVVYCHGAVKDISAEYRKSSIFVLSSRFEGFGLVLAEAMSSGLASVAFACPCGPKDIIKDGEDGILCQNGNTDELALGICRLIENENERKEMGRKALQNIKRYNIDNIMRQWDCLFKEIVAQ